MNHFFGNFSINFSNNAKSPLACALFCLIDSTRLVSRRAHESNKSSSIVRVASGLMHGPSVTLSSLKSRAYWNRNFKNLINFKRRRITHSWLSQLFHLVQDSVGTEPLTSVYLDQHSSETLKLSPRFRHILTSFLMFFSTQWTKAIHLWYNFKERWNANNLYEKVESLIIWNFWLNDWT